MRGEVLGPMASMTCWVKLGSKREVLDADVVLMMAKNCRNTPDNVSLMLPVYGWGGQVLQRNVI